MAIKVNYDAKTGIVLGYYPDDVSYNSIPEPFIEITEEEHQASFSQTMQVINGVFTQYVSTDAQLLSIAISNVTAKITSTRDTLQYANIAYENTTFIATQAVQFQIVGKLQGKQPSDQIIWFDAIGNMMNWTVADLQGLKDTIEARSNSIYAKYYQLIGMISACTVIDNVLDKKGNIVTLGVNGIDISFNS